jgi:phage-related minor tail protein
MGEAGPEAIMPLTRTSGGDLGVKMVGGGSGGDNIVVNVQVDASGTSSEGDNNSSKQLGAMIGNAVKGILIQEKRPGGILA